MNTIRISATDVDALQFYLNPPIPEMEIELDELLRRLRREEPPTAAMMAGSAFHRALEIADYGTVTGLGADGYTFSFGAEAEVELPVIREIKGTSEFLIDDCVATLVGKVDGILGRHIIDHKLTSSFDAEKYMAGFQWKAYLHIFDANSFQWNVFEGKPTIEGGSDYLIRNVHKLEMHRYPGIAEDVERAVRAFVVFARDHLPERFNAPARQAA